MKPNLAIPAPRHRIDFDDEPTPISHCIGSLVHAPALVVAEAAPLAEARRLLAEQRVPALVVVDGGDRVRGIVTRTDVLRARDRDTLVAHAMSGFVFALPANANVQRAAALMAYEGVGQVIVTGPGGALLGMVSAVDLAGYFAFVLRGGA